MHGCSTIQKSAVHGFESGRYKLAGKAKENAYVAVETDSIKVYPIITKKPLLADTTSYRTFALTGNQTALPPKMSKTSIDLDISTVLLKYRFQKANVPNQLSSNLNVNLYSGFRKDYYSFIDQTTPTQEKKRTMNHFEFDFGVFIGLGITPINSSVTENNVTIEYDGMVFQKGLAVFVGMQRITAGLSVGFDNLLDENHHKWIYQQQPWLGLMIGINLGD